MMTPLWLCLSLMVGLACAQNYGTPVGPLLKNAHEVSGDVYIVDSKNIRIREFFYDGEGPDAYFWVGTTAAPGATGTIVPNELGSSGKLAAYSNADVVITLPGMLTVSDIKWLSVWCKNVGVNFGHVLIPASLSCSPAPFDLGTFTTRAHSVSSGKVTVVNDRFVQIKDFSYDGQGPDAFFLVGKGEIKASNGVKASAKLVRAYSSEMVELTLPASHPATKIEWISAYCIQAAQNFGEVTVPKDLCVPPYLSMMYFGEEVGSLTTKNYDVSGTLYVVDSKRIRIREFNYNGKGPDAYFYIGLRGGNASPSEGGTYLLNEMMSAKKLGAYDYRDVVLTLPDGVTSSQIAWFSVWCKDVAVDFGSLVFPSSVTVPAPISLGKLSEKNYDVSSGDIQVLDKKTIKIPMFNYNGVGPDAYFYVGTGAMPSGDGTKVPNEKGSLVKLGKYENVDVVLVLPDDLTVDDIDWISVWCKRASVDFGSAMVPTAPLAVPPYIQLPKANCIQFNPKFNMEWEMMEDHIIFTYSGALGDKGYMAFGVSGSTNKSAMIQADPMVVFMDKGTPKVEDYTISAYSLCAGTNGVCPDTSKGGKNDLEFISQETKDGVTSLKFKRMLKTGDSGNDRDIPMSTYIVWAMGEVNGLSQVTKHTSRSEGNLYLNFGRPNFSNCTAIVAGDKAPVTPWPAPVLQHTQMFEATLGLTGGEKGYSGITGQTSWGIAWYLNGVLIPEITVVRGQTYTFKVEGGSDPSNQAKYHPLYITDDPLGGYSLKSDVDKAKVKIYAGVSMNGSDYTPTVGRYCEYKSNADPSQHNTFKSYKKTLKKECEDGDDVGMFTWTPDKVTPDNVYYQCFTHNYLGWKIKVVDVLPSPSAASTVQSPHVFGILAGILLSVYCTLV